MTKARILANSVSTGNALADGTITIARGGTGATTAAAALTALGAYSATNPSGYTTNTGTVTSVAALTIDTTGTDVSSTVATGTTTPVITLNIPTASATNRGVLSASDWTMFNNKQPAGTYLTSAVTAFSAGTTGLTPSTSTSGAVTLAGTLAIANGGTGATTAAAALIALGAYAATNPSGYITATSTETLDNKRVNTRTISVSSTATLTPDISTDDQFNITAQAVALTIAAPTGTPVDGNRITIRIIDNGTAQTISWNSTYTPIGTTLPVTTTANKIIYVGCVYNSANTRWDVLAVTMQA